MTAVLALSAAALGAVLAWFWRIAPVACAYKARVLCGALFLSGRSVDLESAPEVSADSYRLLRLFRARAEPASRGVTVSFLGLRGKTARAEAAAPGGTDPEPAAAPESRALSRWADEAFAEPDPRRLRRTRALLVFQDGRILCERYAPGFSAATPLPGWSMTKGVLSALVGILVGEGRLSLGRSSLLPEWSSPNDPRGAITLEDLLRMRSGLRFSEKYSGLLSDVNLMLWDSPDCAAYAAARPPAAPPGTVWQYASGTTNILSRLVRLAVGEADYPSYPRRALFEPLGMRSAVMGADAAGNFVGSSLMFATARDWARFGRLYLQDGVWEGRRLLPEGWVAFSRSPTPQSPGGRYGAHWWLKLTKELGGETPAAARIPADAFFALGHEGQTLTVIPSRRLVAVRLGLTIDIRALNHADFTAGLLDALA